MAAADGRPFPYFVGGEPSLRLEWLTDTQQPVVGAAKTYRLRPAPRLTVELAGMSAFAEARRLETALTYGSGGKWHAPLDFDATVLTAAASAGASTLAVDTTDLRFRDGGVAMLRSETQFELVDIDTVSAGALALVTPTVGAWPAGTRIVPTILSRMSAQPALERFTLDQVTYTVGFTAIEPLDIVPATLPTYRGEAVLEVIADAAGAQPLRAPLTVDDGLAAPVVHDINGVPTLRQTVDIATESRSDVSAVLALMYALAGSWRVVWVPSFAADLDVVAASGSTIDVVPVGMAGQALLPNRRDIRFRLRDGSLVYRRITAVAVSGANERMTLDGAAPALGDILAVSFMALCRQDSDTNTLGFWRDGVATSQLAFAGAVNDV